MRLLTSVLVVLAACFAAACGSAVVKTPDKKVAKFEEFKSKDKFLRDDKAFYSGVSDPRLRALLTEKVNLAAGDFETLSNLGPVSEKQYQDLIRIGLDRFADIYVQIDTEDRERICTYFEELMDIAGVKSSGGHLNKFMYGFDPNESP